MAELFPTLKFIVAREASDPADQLHAVVTCAQTDTIKDSDDLRDAIGHALARWFPHPSCGHDRLTMDDYNVGDLANDLDDDVLVGLLADRGVHGLTIEIVHAGAREPSWNYDTVLSSELYDEEADDDA